MEINFQNFCLKAEKINQRSRKNDFLPVFMMGLALLLMVSFGPDLVEFAMADTQGVSLNVTVGSTLTFTVDAGSQSFATLSPGTPKYATSTLTINTNASGGYVTSLTRASTTATLASGANTIGDIPNGNNWTAPSATTTAGPSAVWTSGTTVGLGFRIANQTTSCGYSSTWWGTAEDAAGAKFSGVSTSTASAANSRIANCNFFNGSDTFQRVQYKIDVSGAQATGDYSSSPITFTVTTQ